MAKKKKKKSKGKGGTDRATLLKIGIPVAAVALVPVVVLVSGAFGHSTAIDYDEVFLIDEEHLLLVGSSGSDVDVNRSGRLAYLGPDGKVSWMAEEDGAFSLIGMGREVIWVDNDERGIHARRIADLSVIPETVGKVESHAALKTKRRALGISGESVVLDGMDGPYTLAPDGALQKQTKDFDYARVRFPEALGPPDLPLPAGCLPGSTQSQALARELGKTLTEASFITCGRRRGYVSFDEPPGKLVVDTAYDAQSRTRRLTRIDEEGEVLWATSVRELVAAAPFEEEGGVDTIPWAGFWAGKLRALVEHTSFASGGYDGDTYDYQIVEHRLVVVDHETGRPAEVFVVQMPED